MPTTSILLGKSFAALIATVLGTVGGYNYVSSGSLFSTTDTMGTIPTHTPISSVASAFTPANDPVTVETRILETESPTPCDAEATEHDASCTLTTDHDGVPCNASESTDPELIDPSMTLAEEPVDSSG